MTRQRLLLFIWLLSLTSGLWAAIHQASSASLSSLFKGRIAESNISLAQGAAVAAPASRQFYASPSGSPTADGSIDNPLDLQTALTNANKTIKPGDTLWLRGGIYRGTFISSLGGTETAPIIVRQYPGERATIDSNPADNYNPSLRVNGAWTYYWGFEITNSYPVRSLTHNGTPTEVRRGIGVDVHGPNTKFINLIVHDNAGGYGMWVGAVNAEVYGNLIYYNGWDTPGRGHGHGIYTQNNTGIRRLTDNIIFSQFDHGIHAYGSDAAYINNIQAVGNTVFSNGNGGLAKRAGSGRNILIGGARVAENPVAQYNYTYLLPGIAGANNFGYSVGCENLLATDNYFVGDFYPLTLSHWGPTQPSNCRGELSGNTLIGATDEAFQAQYPKNTYLRARPTTGSQVFIRPNKYEVGRANITIYNWAKADSVEVDISRSGLKVGEAFQVRAAQNFYGTPVLTSTYDGKPVAIPMTEQTVAEPFGSGFKPPVHTGPQFGSFVLLPGNATFTQPAQKEAHAVGTGTGLTATYFDDENLTEQKLTRLEPTINFDYKYGSPGAQISHDTFSARFSGQVQPRYSETYTFYTDSDDGVRLWVDNKLLIDNWKPHPPTEDRGVIELKAGQKYDIKLEMFEAAEESRIRLRWSSESTPKEIIPSTQLYPAQD